MPLRAMCCLGLPRPPLFVFIPHVVRVRANEQMLRIEARRIVATMQHVQRGIEVKPKEQVGGYAVDASPFFIERYPPVPARIPRACPFPTLRFFVDSPM